MKIVSGVSGFFSSFGLFCSSSFSIIDRPFAPRPLISSHLFPAGSISSFGSPFFFLLLCLLTSSTDRLTDTALHYTILLLFSRVSPITSWPEVVTWRRVKSNKKKTQQFEPPGSGIGNRRREWGITGSKRKQTLISFLYPNCTPESGTQAVFKEVHKQQLHETEIDAGTRADRQIDRHAQIQKTTPCLCLCRVPCAVLCWGVL